MNADRTDRLESALRNIISMSRRAILERPQEVPQGPWDFILSSIEVYAEQALEDEPKIDGFEIPEKPLTNELNIQGGEPPLKKLSVAKETQRAPRY